MGCCQSQAVFSGPGQGDKTFLDAPLPRRTSSVDGRLAFPTNRENNSELVRTVGYGSVADALAAIEREGVCSINTAASFETLAKSASSVIHSPRPSSAFDLSWAVSLDALLSVVGGGQLRAELDGLRTPCVHCRGACETVLWGALSFIYSVFAAAGSSSRCVLQFVEHPFGVWDVLLAGLRTSELRVLIVACQLLVLVGETPGGSLKLLEAVRWVQRGHMANKFDLEWGDFSPLYPLTAQLELYHDRPPELLQNVRKLSDELKHLSVAHPASECRSFFDYGETEMARGFADHVLLLTRACMCFWQCLPSRTFPNGMRRFTYAEQNANKLACGQGNAKLKAHEVHLEQLRSDEKANAEKIEDVLNQMKAINRQMTACVMGVEDDIIEKLVKQDLFLESKRYNSRSMEYDPELGDLQQFQAGRNVWTCFGLQAVYWNKPAELTDAVFGYSMLYPYTDNYLDNYGISETSKREFQARFQRRLANAQTPDDEMIWQQSSVDRKTWDQVVFVENQWPREANPRVFLSMIAINDAQTQSLDAVGELPSYQQLLRTTCYKGGTSVLADTFIVGGEAVSRSTMAFAFALGVALQMVDDIQDVEEDTAARHHTLFTGQQTTAVEEGSRRLSHLIWYVCSRPPNTRPDAEPSPSQDWPSPTGLQRLMLNMCLNMVLKAISRAPRQFGPAFQAEWGPLGALPSTQMSKLKSMKHLLYLVKRDQI